jgi:hypothetical protein
MFFGVVSMMLRYAAFSCVVARTIWSPSSRVRPSNDLQSESGPVGAPRFAPVDGRDWRLLAEMFTMLKRTGAAQVITYAAEGLAAALG